MFAEGLVTPPFQYLFALKLLSQSWQYVFKESHLHSYKHPILKQVIAKYGEDY